ncbi:3-isopropylmalate dehydratase small subunit [Umezawaea endophytica]|uniref:3-isopropylmalate dehydratase small subunit n=1 Tax=Umezawaea endophytica TaxID=1654476 RepID=A0A9X2VIB0_9PSEU|nr:3-isopropylmalate dehydratase small subunit [Umezawaea endophytica]MCS7476899.1 3-isopropylmalate dehydratase small subunit [Umezawaea endophytica]
MSTPTSHTGTAVPLRRDDVDTDQLSPARFVPYFRPHGFTNILFADWRSDPDFVLNRPEHQGASVLVAGHDFGTGSSRESAVWALQSAGFQVVVASGFGDIFRDNATTRGLWTVEVDHDVVEELWREVEADPWLPVTVDLTSRRLGFRAAESPLRIDDPLLRRLVRPGDRIAETLAHVADIEEYESSRISRGDEERAR